MSMPKPQRFSAKIYKLGINPCVDVPKRVSRAFGQKGYVPVKGRLAGQPIRATLVPMGSGRHRLFVNGDMRERAKVDTGDRAEFVLSLDAGTRTVPLPEALAQVLKNKPRAKVAFDQLRPSRQKEILLYLNWLKQPESLKRNVDRVIANLGKGTK